MRQEFDLFSVEGVPNQPITTTPLSAVSRRRPRRVAPLRTVLLVAVGVLLALVLVRAALRFHSEYNLLAEVRREGTVYWRTVCNEGHTRPPNSYDQCTRAKTAAHQFTRYGRRRRRRRRLRFIVCWPSSVCYTWRCATSTPSPIACPARRARTCG